MSLGTFSKAKYHPSVKLRAAAELELRRRAHSAGGGGVPVFNDWLPIVAPSYRWDWAHLQYIQTALESVTDGTTKRLMLFLPPRHGKSEMTTVRYPVWRLEREPHLRVIIGAYNQMLANSFNRKARKIAAERFTLSDRVAVEDWQTPDGGGIRAAGVGAGVTGRGADLVIIDDPVKNREEAESPTYRDRVWDWYTDDLYTRLEPGASLILIMTRWHEDDLAGRILASERASDWHIVNLPALAEINDPLGRAEGAALCPERYDETALASIQEVLGSRSFVSLYQQRPQPAEGALFKREWFDVVDSAPEGLRWGRYWDLAASTKTSADYTASGAVAHCADDGCIYIRDMVRGRWEWPDARKIIVSTMLSEPYTTHAIEEALHGLAAVQDLRRERAIAHVTLRGVHVDRDKVTRALPWSARAEARKVKLVRGPWIGAFLSEVCMFPQGTHDDQVDTVSGGVELVAPGRTNSAVGAFAR
jgi:predicted phage terminase large subunit-like protein